MALTFGTKTVLLNKLSYQFELFHGKIIIELLEYGTKLISLILKIMK